MTDIERVSTESDRAGDFVVRIARRLSPGALTEVVIRLDNADNVYILSSYHGDTTMNVKVGPSDPPIRNREARLILGQGDSQYAAPGEPDQGEVIRPYRVIVRAQNLRPKVVEFPNGARTGVFRSKLTLTLRDISHEVVNSRHITASEWDKKGLTDSELRQMAQLAQHLTPA